MAYAAATDFIARFGADELLQLSGSSGDSPALDQALADAGNEIDSYLAVRYQLPLSTVPPVLARVACDIARYRLWDQGASEEVANRYAADVKWLSSVANGSVLLGITPPPTGGAEEPAPLWSGNGVTFDGATLADYLDPSAGPVGS
jgi:Mu-like prophage protein gp36